MLHFSTLKLNNSYRHQFIQCSTHTHKQHLHSSVDESQHSSSSLLQERKKVCVCVWDEGLGMLSARPSKKPQGTSAKEIIIFYLLCCDGRLWFKFTIVKETIQHEAALLKVVRGSQTSERTPTMPQKLILHDFRHEAFQNKVIRTQAFYFENSLHKSYNNLTNDHHYFTLCALGGCQRYPSDQTIDVLYIKVWNNGKICQQ